MSELKKLHAEIMKMWGSVPKGTDISDNVMNEISKLESDFLEEYKKIFPKTMFESGQDIIYHLKFNIDEAIKGFMEVGINLDKEMDKFMRGY